VTPGWSATPRGRRELLAVAVFCAANLIVPLIWVEMFPFSRAPMFADAPRLYCSYVIETPDRQRLGETKGKDPRRAFEELKPFGLERTYWGNPLGVGVGFEPARTVDRFGEVASKEEIDESVRRGLAGRPEWDYVFVKQTVIGPTDGGRVGTKQKERWRVDRRGEAP
jgi:hypothetical protein